MMAWWILGVLVVVLLLAAWWAWQNLARPALALRDDLSRVVVGKKPRRSTRPAAPLIQGMRADLEQLSERLEELERQASDESVNLRTILSSMVEGVLIADADLRVRLVNEGLRRMFRLESSPLNRSLMEVFRNADLQGLASRALETRSAQSGEISHEVRGEDSTYERKYFSVTIVAIAPVEGRTARALAAVVVFHDVTDIRNLAAVRQEFVANVSHELRTPLSILNGYLETLLDGALEDREMAENACRVMQRHAARLNLIVEDLLTLSLLESRASLLDRHSADLSVLVARVLEEMESRISKRGAVVEVLMDPACPPLSLDTHRIEQALFNLLDNALKYSHRPEPRIRIASRTLPDEVELEVADDGPGIPLDDQPHLFERFYRVHKDRSRDAGGTGLGLSIVKHIAQAHGGQVTVKSLPGEGACFTIQLPLDATARGSLG